MSEMRRWERHHSTRTVVLADPGQSGWTLARVLLRDRLLARWHGPSLDRQLAAGRLADLRRLRAVRAGMLVAPSRRRELASCWQQLLTGRVSPLAPVRWAQVEAARPEIEELVTALRAPRPVPARGVAIARLLLTDGTGPLYRPQPQQLRHGVREALHHLDPLDELVEGGHPWA